MLAAVCSGDTCGACKARMAWTQAAMYMLSIAQVVVPMLPLPLGCWCLDADPVGKETSTAQKLHELMSAPKMAVWI